jgi:hypothetical protein
LVVHVIHVIHGVAVDAHDNVYAADRNCGVNSQD